MSFSTTDLDLHVEVASLEAIDEMIEDASSPQAPYDSATMGTHTHPSSEHLGIISLMFPRLCDLSSRLGQNSRFQKGLHQDISDLVVAGDHISTIFAGDCMVAKVIKYTAAQDDAFHGFSSEEEEGVDLLSSILDREEPSGHEEKKTRHNSNVVRREERMISPPSGEVSDDELTSMKGEGILLNQILELDSAYVQASQDPPVVQGCALMVLHLFDREVSLEVARQRKLDAESGVVTEKYTGLRINDISTNKYIVYHGDLYDERSLMDHGDLYDERSLMDHGDLYDERSLMDHGDLYDERSLMDHGDLYDERSLMDL
eukprot:Em0403g2a